MICYQSLQRIAIVVGFLVVIQALLLVPLLPVVVAKGEEKDNILCDAGSFTTHHVVFGKGFCYKWSPPETSYSCCLFCDQMDTMVSRYMPTGGRNPFNGDDYGQQPGCCCYKSGVLVEGGDGTKYYSG